MEHYVQWNLRSRYTRGGKCSRLFADDIAFLVQTRYLGKSKLYTSKAIIIIKSLFTSVNLQLEEHKTEIILLKRGRKSKVLSTQIGTRVPGSHFR